MRNLTRKKKAKARIGGETDLSGLEAIREVMRTLDAVAPARRAAVIAAAAFFVGVELVGEVPRG